MEEGKKSSVSIKPLRFVSLSEDQSADSSCDDDKKRNTTLNTNPQNDNLNNELQLNVAAADAIITKLKPNFSFEYSYPAVIFDNVCFSIDKTQQQSNFLKECLFKLKRCISPASDSSRERVEILKSVNLSVPYGSIFGLLGPSSCGKTTLLRCLVGLLRPNSGNVRLFCTCSEDFNRDKNENLGIKSSCGFCCSLGRASNTISSSSRSSSSSITNSKSSRDRRKECKVPGPNVGYMPQDLGLYEDFTIRQLLTMFGQYMRMGSKLIASRIEFMGKFLDLPHVDREISSLSGGQKRRVSFAIACLHMPPLIILDEPTVGVDPLLRKSIWKYLRRLADEENKTIIITTHYIEEAAQADQVALMREGEILVQDTPGRIMEANDCKTLEEAFLKICNNVQRSDAPGDANAQSRYKLYPQPRFVWHDKSRIRDGVITPENYMHSSISRETNFLKANRKDSVAITAQAIEKQVMNGLKANVTKAAQSCELHNLKLEEKINKLSMEPNSVEISFKKQFSQGLESPTASKLWKRFPPERNSKIKSFRGQKLIINDTCDQKQQQQDEIYQNKLTQKFKPNKTELQRKVIKSLTLMWALLYKNYRRNVNSLPLLAFQFMLPVIQMISFSLCVGGRPTNIGLGLVNHEQLAQLNRSQLILTPSSHMNVNGSSFSTNSSSRDGSNVTSALSGDLLASLTEGELLSDRYLSFIDESIITIKPYNSLKEALHDVRRAKLWAAMEISENFTTAMLSRFDLENFYQLDGNTIRQSVIKLYPDRSNKVLDMICHRSLVNSYRQFLLDQFEHFRKLPIEVKEPIFSIKPNLISNSIDGYTESIAAGLLASLTYIMAAGLTTFIMVVERSAGILERTFTSGISPVAYLIAHAVFRSFVMMLQIAVVMFLTFYILQQPLVGSIWLAYIMLMTLNLTGICYGLLISSIVTDQNGAALTIVSSLVVKITMSGILWPFEAIPRWLRTVCYIQPLTMPIQALKSITLKGAGLEDRTVQLGFLVSLSWLALFLTIAAKRFKFYQH